MAPSSGVSWHLESKKRVNWLQSKCSAHHCHLLSARLVPWLSKTVLQCGHQPGHSLEVTAVQQFCDCLQVAKALNCEKPLGVNPHSSLQGKQHALQVSATPVVSRLADVGA